jgi:multicomponent K+:H+ antiporter subunit D
MSTHLVVVPIVLPLATAAFLVLVGDRHHLLKAAISVGACGLLIAAAAAVMLGAVGPEAQVYRLGDWPAPFGIVLLADRLSALMVLVAAILASAALVFSLARWHSSGPHFHSLVHFLLAGLNGAFLTGDLFNLFVFFELLLAASYGLALHGSGARRVRAGLHYIVVNLAASLLFLVGVSLMYGIAGTLNMADLAVLLPAIDPADRALLEIGAAMLGIAFVVKAGMWPLGFWLPATYTAAPAPSAALFAILSKVGVYAIVRVWTLVFGGATGAEFLAYGGMVTIAFGILGVLASQNLGRLASSSLFISSGTVFAAIGLGGPAATAAGLYYLVASTLGIGALFLLIELVERARAPAADLLALTAEAFGLADAEDDEPEEEVGIVIPAAMAALGLCYLCAAVIVAGLPPLPTFLAKFALLAGLLDAPTPGAVWLLLTLTVVSGVAAVIGFGRAGVRIFWASGLSVPRVRLLEILPVAALLAVCIALAIGAGPVLRYMHDAADALHAPTGYIRDVLRAP